jgi:hypothetical protein
MEKYASVVETLQRPLLDALSEIANTWSTLGLSAETLAERASVIEGCLARATDSILAKERHFASKERDKFEVLKHKASLLAREAGDDLKLDGLTLAEKEAEIRKETDRLKDIVKQQDEELDRLTKRLKKEAVELDLLDSEACQYTIPSCLSGAPAVEAGRRLLKEIKVVRTKRLAEAESKRNKIVSLSKLYASRDQRLTFRLQMEGELIGYDDGVVVLARNDKSQQFLRQFRLFEADEDRTMMATRAYSSFLDDLEWEYSNALKRLAAASNMEKRSQGPRGSGGRSISPCQSQDSEYTMETVLSNSECETSGNLKRRSASESPPLAKLSDRQDSAIMPYHKAGVDTARRGEIDRVRVVQTAEDIADSIVGAAASVPSRASRKAAMLPYRRCVRSNRRHSSDARSCSHARFRSRRCRPHSRSRSCRQKPRRRSRSASIVKRELCQDGLRLMQGPWIDAKGYEYVVKDMRVERYIQGVFKPFVLFIDDDVIGWGKAPLRFYAKPSADLRHEVRWINAKTQRIDYVWKRPA